jgi:hypothetical protein
MTPEEVRNIRTALGIENAPGGKIAIRKGSQAEKLIADMQDPESEDYNPEVIAKLRAIQPELFAGNN